MKNHSTKSEIPNTDLFRITRSKSAIGLTPPALRKLLRQGLPHYKLGRKLVFVSKREFEAFVREKGSTNAQ
jgi:hypothetical protein